MAVSFWYQGRNSQTTATVVVRCDSTEDIDVIANGVTLTASCDTSVNDGNAIVEFTDLSPGSKYPYTVNGVDGGVLKTMYADGPYWLAFTSCWNISRFDSLAKRLVNVPVVQLGDTTLMTEMVDRLVGFYNLGDRFYCNISGTVNGVSLSKIDDGGTITNAKDQSLRYRYNLSSMMTPGVTDLIRNVPTLIQKDDHEYDPDNASYSVDWLDFNYTGPFTQVDLDEVWTVCTNAFRAYTLGNPARVLDSDYFKVDYHNLTVCVTDLIQERDYIQDTDGPDKRMMSDAQEQQFLNDMSGSTKPFKVWASTKQFISSCGRNSDGWFDLPGGSSGGYQTQLNRILSDSRFPSGGCLSVTGDEHIKSDMFVTEGYFGSNKAISQISAGPATIEVINDPNDGSTYRDGVVNKERVFEVNTDFTVDLGENSYVLFRVMDDRIERYVLGSRYGLKYMGYVSRTSNQVNR